MINILLVNHNLSKFCGIYSHGKRMGEILKKSKKYNFIYVECDSAKTLINFISKYSVKFIIYNYTDALLPWVKIFIANRQDLTHIALCHDITQPEIDSGMKIDGFDYRVALDPTLRTNNKWFTSVRPMFGYTKKENSRNRIPTIGSFGFYFKHKNFEPLVSLVSNQYEQALIRLHITKAYFSSSETQKSFDVFCDQIKQHNDNSKIKIELSYDYISDTDLIDFLSLNDINIFLYSMNYGMGPSSAVDYAVAAGRPILLSNSYQFNHVKNILPTITDCTIEQCISLGNAKVLQLQEQWSEENFRKDYEDMIYEMQD